MASQIRVAARRDAREALERRRKEREELDAKREGYALSIMTALVEREAQVAAAEKEAGAALVGLVGTGLGVREALDWVEGLTEREAGRLIKLAQPKKPDPEQKTSDAATTG